MILVESNSKDAAYHFSVEELFTRYIRKNEPVLMLWQTGKTVMLGNNQLLEAEVDIEFALESAITIVRRSSGGGAIYTDHGTVLYTVIQPLTNSTASIREDVASKIIKALIDMEVPAVREGRNDILVDGKKISGFAQYTSGSHVCTHGSLLYNTDLDTLDKVLIANENKLRPKGITSIRSRVTNIKPYLKENLTTEAFINKLKATLFNTEKIIEYKISNENLAKIDQINTDKYSNQEWNYRKW